MSRAVWIAVSVWAAAAFGGVAVAAPGEPPPALPPQPPAFTVEVDHAGLADNFLSGLTGWSPETLGTYLDIRDRIEIGRLLLTGDYAGAAKAAVEHVSGKAIGAIPVIGQWYALAQAGESLGGWAIQHFGSERFASAYAAMAAQLSEDEWNRPYGDPSIDPLLATLDNANLLTFIDQQTGGGHTPDELRRMLWEMLQGKHRFEVLCDRYGLTGEERTYAALERAHAAELDRFGRAARAVEDDRAEREKRKRLAKWEAEQRFIARRDAERKARTAEICAAWQGKLSPVPEWIPERPSDALVAELCGGAPVAEAGGEADFLPLTAFSPERGESGPIVWRFFSRGGGGLTRHELTIVNRTDAPLAGIVIEARPAGPYSAGTANTDPLIASDANGGETICAGCYVKRTIRTGGDIQGTAVRIIGPDGLVAELMLASKHDTAPHWDAQYTGRFEGGWLSGRIVVNVTGNAVSGVFHGRRGEGDDVLTLEATFTGTLDPATGRLTSDDLGGVAWSGPPGRMRFREVVLGKLSGTLSGAGLSGDWSLGNFAGRDVTISETGTWSAAR